MSERLIASTAVVRDHGAPELGDVVRAGAIAVSAADRRIAGGFPDPPQAARRPDGLAKAKARRKRGYKALSRALQEDTSWALLANPLAQTGDRRREGDDEGTSETCEQHACSCHRDQINRPCTRVSILQIEVSGAAFVPICLNAHGSIPFVKSFNAPLPKQFLVAASKGIWK